MNELISIIIPVYQVEKYLERCLESIVHQTYKELEIILVDDGSTDKSGEICDRYAAFDSRIKVVHKENGGLVSARKAGIKIATGKLIAYVDSDDYIDLDMYEKMYGVMIKDNVDVVVCAHMEEYPHKILHVKNYVQSGKYIGNGLEKIYSCMLYEKSIRFWGLSPACWDKLFKKELIYDLQLSVNELIWDGEDHAFIYAGLLEANGISVMDEPLYHHVIRENSVATGIDERAFERFNALFLQCKSQFEKSEYWDKYLKKQFPYQMRWFLHKHIHTELGVPAIPGANEDFGFLFPFESVEKNDNIVIYGAGDVGKEFYKQIVNSGYCNVIAWVSMDYEDNQYSKYLSSPDILTNIEFDKVIIAVLDEVVAEEITKEIKNKRYGIADDQIIWKKPFCRGVEL